MAAALGRAYVVATDPLPARPPDHHGQARRARGRHVGHARAAARLRGRDHAPPSITRSRSTRWSSRDVDQPETLDDPRRERAAGAGRRLSHPARGPGALGGAGGGAREPQARAGPGGRVGRGGRAGAEPRRRRQPSGRAAATAGGGAAPALDASCARSWATAQRCKLSGGRKNIVFGVGNPEADLVFVGEAPGRRRGRAGRALRGGRRAAADQDDRGHGLSRASDVYICNVIKCRPPYNRNPEPDEVAACEPFLKKQLAAHRPAHDRDAGQVRRAGLCREDTPITRLRGNLRSYEGIPVMPTYHPAFLLRTPEAKRQAWSDLQAVMAALARMGIAPPCPPGPERAARPAPISRGRSLRQSMRQLLPRLIQTSGLRLSGGVARARW